MTEIKRTNQRTVFLCAVFAVMWAVIPFTGLFSADATSSISQCPNGPMSADLSGGAANGGPSGRAMFREKGKNGLMVNVRGATADSSLDVFIGDTKVGTIAVGKGRSGQLRLDSTTATIDEGTTISLRNGSTTVASGTFQCVAGGPSTSPTTSPTGSPSVSPTTMPTGSPSVSPTTMPTTSPSTSPTMEPKTKPE